MELISLKNKLFFLKIYSFIKTNWLSFILGIGIIYAAMIAKNKEENISLLISERERINEEHQKTLENIQSQVENEIKKRQEIEKKYNDLMLKIKNEYDQGVIEIAETKKKEIKALIERNNENPEAMANSINQLFGIQLIEMKEIT